MTENSPWYQRILEKQGFAILFGCWALWVGTDLAAAHKQYLIDTANGLTFLNGFAQRTDEKHSRFDLQLAALRTDQQRTSQAIIDVLRELAKNDDTPLGDTTSGT